MVRRRPRFSSFGRQLMSTNPLPETSADEDIERMLSRFKEMLAELPDDGELATELKRVDLTNAIKLTDVILRNVRAAGTRGPSCNSDDPRPTPLGSQLEATTFRAVPHPRR